METNKCYKYIFLVLIIMLLIILFCVYFDNYCIHLVICALFLYLSLSPKQTGTFVEIMKHLYLATSVAVLVRSVQKYVHNMTS